MKGKIGYIINVATYLGCVLGLTGIALKRNKDAFDAQMECIGLECKLYAAQADNLNKDAEIKQLKAKIEKLQK